MPSERMTEKRLNYIQRTDSIYAFDYIQELVKEIRALQSDNAKLQSDVADWKKLVEEDCEDEELIRKAISEKTAIDVRGDTYSVPDIPYLVDSLLETNAKLQAENEELKKIIAASGAGLSHETLLSENLQTELSAQREELKHQIAVLQIGVVQIEAGQCSTLSIARQLRSTIEQLEALAAGSQDKG